MKKDTIRISVPKNTTEEEIKTIRDKYKDKYKVNIVVSGKTNVEEYIKDILIARIS